VPFEGSQPCPVQDTIREPYSIVVSSISGQAAAAAYFEASQISFGVRFKEDDPLLARADWSICAISHPLAYSSQSYQVEVGFESVSWLAAEIQSGGTLEEYHSNFPTGVSAKGKNFIIRHFHR
jgi:hypothetical protein